jgi:hypothetical protein
MAEERERDAHGRFVSQSEDADADAQAEPESGAPNQSQTTDEQDISDTVAPSIGPHTTFTKDTPEERLAKHEQSTEDAMGLDKRRSVVGGQYGASFAKQAGLYGGFLAVLAVLIVGFILLAQELDQPPENIEVKAPWAEGEQTPPEEIQ